MPAQSPCPALFGCAKARRVLSAPGCPREVGSRVARPLALSLLAPARSRKEIPSRGLLGRFCCFGRRRKRRRRRGFVAAALLRLPHPRLLRSLLIVPLLQRLSRLGPAGSRGARKLLLLLRCPVLFVHVLLLLLMLLLLHVEPLLVSPGSRILAARMCRGGPSVAAGKGHPLRLGTVRPLRLALLLLMLRCPLLPLLRGSALRRDRRPPLLVADAWSSHPAGPRPRCVLLMGAPLESARHSHRRWVSGRGRRRRRRDRRAWRPRARLPLQIVRRAAPCRRWCCGQRSTVLFFRPLHLLMRVMLLLWRSLLALVRPSRLLRRWAVRVLVLPVLLLLLLRSCGWEGWERVRSPVPRLRLPAP